MYYNRVVLGFQGIVKQASLCTEYNLEPWASHLFLTSTVERTDRVLKGLTGDGQSARDRD